MDFIKNNFRIIVIIATIVFVCNGLFTIRPHAEEANFDKLKEQKVTTFAQKDIFTKLKLGLDLVGGSQFEFEAKPTDKVPEIGIYSRPSETGLSPRFTSANIAPYSWSMSLVSAASVNAAGVLVIAFFVASNCP